MTPPKLWKQPIDFFARREHFIVHLLPVWNAMKSSRGKFYIPAYLEGYAQERGLEDYVCLPPVQDNVLNICPPNMGPLVVAAYGDMVIVQRHVPQRPFIMMEHGVGLTFNGSPGYAGGTGMRQRVSMFLAPNEYIRAKTARALPMIPQVVIGTPKLDSVISNQSPVISGRKPVVCISFHWNGEKVAPEAGNALKYYKDILPELARQSDFRLIGHGHPKYHFVLEPLYRELGIDAVWDFQTVMAMADLYVNDCSSTMYEFCVTGKPVVIMNAPWFRRNVKHGIRFWDYTDIGPQVEEPGQLLQVIRDQLSVISGQKMDMYRDAREKMVKELYPFIGCSAQRAAGAILGFVGGKRG